MKSANHQQQQNQEPALTSGSAMDGKGKAERQGALQVCQCGRVHPADDVAAVGRFNAGGASGYVAQRVAGAEVRATRIEAMADVCRHWQGDNPNRQQEREQAFALIYRHEHRDYKGRQADGTRTLMSWARYGGGMVCAATITDAELAERLPYARDREARRRGLDKGNRP